MYKSSIYAFLINNEDAIASCNEFTQIIFNRIKKICFGYTMVEFQFFLNINL